MVTSPENNVVFVSFIEGSEEDKQAKLTQFFNGDTARWASKKAHLLGNIIIPKHVCITLPGIVRAGEPSRPHFSYYVEHSGILAETEESFHRHHVVCDCVLKKNLNDGRGGVNVKACSDLYMSTVLRARRFGKDIRSDLSAAREIETDQYKISVLNDKLALGAIEVALAIDDTTPEAWPGTVVSGELPLELAVEMTGQPEENVLWYADILESSGRVTFDGQNLKLAA